MEVTVYLTEQQQLERRFIRYGLNERYHYLFARLVERDDLDLLDEFANRFARAGELEQYSVLEEFGRRIGA